jgi:hypothetical protein
MPCKVGERYRLSLPVGTAQDISFLIDFLPSYISPNGELEIERWGVAGISLGGHSTWLALAHGVLFNLTRKPPLLMGY